MKAETGLLEFRRLESYRLGKMPKFPETYGSSCGEYRIDKQENSSKYAVYYRGYYGGIGDNLDNLDDAIKQANEHAAFSRLFSMINA